MSYPCKREAELVNESLGTEMIVYDERSRQAHHLSEDAVVVWECCDGVRSLDAIALVCALPLEHVVAAVTELARCDLLEDDRQRGPLLDRRGLLVRAAALSVPLITTSAVYPAFAHASTGAAPQFTLAATISGLSSPSSVAFSRDGKLLAVANYSGTTVVVYPVTAGSPDTVTTTPVATITGLSVPSSVAFSPDGTLLAVAENGVGKVTVYPVTLGATDAVTTAAVATIDNIGDAYSVAFSPDGTLLAVGGVAVDVYPVTLGNPDTVSTSAVATMAASHPSSVAFSRDGKLLAVAEEQGDEVAVYPVTLGSPDAVSTTAVATISITQPTSVAFSPDGKLLAVGNKMPGMTGSAVVYPVTVGGTDSVTTTATATISGLSETSSVAFSPDGQLLAVGTINGSTVTVYPITLASSDTLTTTAVATLTSADGISYAESVAFSPDGTLLAVANGLGDTVTVYLRS